MATKATAPASVLSFTDLHGAVITVPADVLPVYIGIKTEQLKALTQVLKERLRRH